jgi:hypothetical protein
MTGFAVHVSVFTSLFGVGNINVTCLTSVVTGKLHWACGNLAHCCSAVVTILAEAWRHNKVADHQKQQKSKDKEPGKSEQMSCIL